VVLHEFVFITLLADIVESFLQASVLLDEDVETLCLKLGLLLQIRRHCLFFCQLLLQIKVLFLKKLDALLECLIVVGISLVFIEQQVQRVAATKDLVNALALHVSCH